MSGRKTTPSGPPAPKNDRPGEAVSRMSAWQVFGRILGTRRRHVAGILLLGAASVTMTVFGPVMLGRATDLVLAGVLGRQFRAGTTNQQAVARLRAHGDSTMVKIVTRLHVVPGRGIDFPRVGEVLLIALLLYVAAATLLFIQGRLVARVGQTAVAELRDQVEGKLGRLPLRYFDGQPRGELISRVTNDIDNVSHALERAQPVTAVMSVAGSLLMMFFLSPVLALVIVVTVPLLVFVSGRIAKRSQAQAVKRMSRTGRLFSHVEEQYTGHLVTRLAGRQDETDTTFVEHNDALYDASVRAVMISGTIWPVTMFVSSLNYVLIAVVGVLLIASGSLSLGSVQAFIQYSARFNQPISQIAQIVNRIQLGVVSGRRVFGLLDEPEQSAEPDRPARPRTVRGRVEFQDVSFRYVPDTPVIEDLSLTVQPGQTVAVVGPTGAGKTTLVNLLMRFYDTDSGRITLDGIDISAMHRAQLRSQIGMVLQDVWLFGGTIADNIGYGARDPSFDDIVEAARAAHVDDFVRALPQGYDTVLRDNDVLSAGEKQLITVARAFLARPAILVLDEATGAVDTRTEAHIQKAMSTLRAGRTSFVIAHRLSTIRDADVIVVMESGRIVQQGDHAALLSAGGLYARMYAAQFGTSTTGTGSRG